MPSATAPTLSANDSSVLSALFDLESSLASNPTAQILPSLPPLPNVPESSLAMLQNRERAAILPLNKFDPSKGALTTSISILTDILADEPSYASAWNNRAQALRMLHGDLGPKTAEILADLAKAIALASPETPSSAVGSLQAKVLAGAHAQYGYILYKISKIHFKSAMQEDNKGQTQATIELPESLKFKSYDELEEMASRHFARAGAYGNEAAREMAVRTNPYAKLCGSIVKGALMEEVKGGVKPKVEVALTKD